MPVVVTKTPVSKTTEYHSYNAAKRRCTVPTTHNYRYYGDRGIQFKFSSFEEFLKHLGPKPKGYQLDRINPEGNYEPGNVRWQPRAESQRNQRVLRANSKTNFRGVAKHRDQYQVQVSDPRTGQTVYLCCVNDPQEGARIYDRVERLLRGNLALCNGTKQAKSKANSDIRHCKTVEVD